MPNLVGDADPDCLLTSPRFCCAANVVTASEAREPDVYRDCSNRLLESRRSVGLLQGGATFVVLRTSVVRQLSLPDSQRTMFKASCRLS